MEYILKEKEETEVCVFTHKVSGFGKVEFRSMQIEKDVELIHNWVNKEYALYWGMIGKSREEVKNEYKKIIKYSNVFIGKVNGEVAFLLEKYNPAKDEIGKHYSVKEYDCGIHVIVAPTIKPIHNFTWHIFTAIMKFIFSDLSIQRVLVEPDIRNEKMFKICHRIGFVDDKKVELSNKVACLSFCTRAQFVAKYDEFIKKETLSKEINDDDNQNAIFYLKSEKWRKVNKMLVKKVISEFLHEGIFIAEKKQRDNFEEYYKITTDNSAVFYTFKAQKTALNHWLIDEDSIVRSENIADEIDAVKFLNECKEIIGISTELFPSYVEEVISTLHGSMYKVTHNNYTAKELIYADFQTIEQSMFEGHPAFIANNGRIGFNNSDYKKYTPEAGKYFKIIWLAGKKEKTVFAGTDSLDYETFIREELGEELLVSFQSKLVKKGLEPTDYFFMPVHPWQWLNKLVHLFSPEIAKNNLIFLGESLDGYQAQQSIRTLFNVSNPHKMYVKTSLSILNMGFMRGLPVYYLGTAPKMAMWLQNLLGDDKYLNQVRFQMLGEVASISYINSYFENYGKHNSYNKMIASLWRESPVKYCEKGEKLMTMAALLHIDNEGGALLIEMIKASKKSVEDWLLTYFEVYLTPLLHCFYEYDLVFMPHGENIILGFENHIPVRSFIKDITEEAVILNPDVILPENLSRMYAEVPEDIKLLSIFIDVFDGFFRYLSGILVTQIGFDENLFWRLVAKSIYTYQDQYPHLQTKFEKYDLFAHDFQLSCLNRLQLNNNTTMIDLDDPVALLQFQGRIENPIAPFKKVTV